MATRFLALLLLATVLGGSGCSERDPLEALIDEVIAAAEDRDADALGKLLTADFTAGDGSDREGTLRTARQFLMAYQALDIELSDVELNRRGDSGRARFRAKLTGVPTSFGGLGDLVPRQATYDFDVTARDDGGTWKLASASWTEPASP